MPARAAAACAGATGPPAAVLGEFELIARHFTRAPRAGGPVRQGVGDDCALLDIGGRTLALTADLLVEGRHFAAGADPQALGHKALAVNLSDLAAAGAAPVAFLLSLALPRADDAWLASFARGLFALADAHRCELIGGDTTRAPRIAQHDGPITVGITALGEVPAAEALSRGGAREGDDLWVSGELGDAALALAQRSGEVTLAAGAAARVGERLDRPQPRVALGLALRGLASACIDVSDGLLGDLGHVVARSGVGAQVAWTEVPRSTALRAQPEALQRRCALAGGDDYELLFTVPAQWRAEVARAARGAGVPVTRIGRMIGARIEVVDGSGRAIDTSPLRPYDHFG